MVSAEPSGMMMWFDPSREQPRITELLQGVDLPASKCEVDSTVSVRAMPVPGHGDGSEVRGPGFVQGLLPFPEEV